MSSIVDIHPHIVSPDTQRYPLAPLGGKQSTWSAERPTTYHDLLEAMDEAGVAKAAIVHSSTAYGYDNSYAADAVTAVPSRFAGVYSIEVLAPDGTVLATRVLFHPHDDEQPFTRDVAEGRVPRGVDRVRIRAHFKPTGYNGDVLEVRLGAR